MLTACITYSDFKVFSSAISVNDERRVWHDLVSALNNTRRLSHYLTVNECIYVS